MGQRLLGEDSVSSDTERERPLDESFNYFFFFLLVAFLPAFFLAVFFFAAFFLVGFFAAFFLVAFFEVIFLVDFFVAEPNAEPQPSAYFSFVPTRKIVISVLSKYSVVAEQTCVRFGHCLLYGSTLVSTRRECSCTSRVSLRRDLRPVVHASCVRRYRSCLRTRSVFRHPRTPGYALRDDPGTSGRDW